MQQQIKEKLKESPDKERNLSERMPEKKEVRKTKPIAREPTIAEEKERSHRERKMEFKIKISNIEEENVVSKQLHVLKAASSSPASSSSSFS